MTHPMLDGVGHVENSESRSHDQHSNWCRLTCSVHSNSSFFSVELIFHNFFSIVSTKLQNEHSEVTEVD